MLTGELFIHEGLIQPEQLETALERQRELGGSVPIAQVLVMLGMIDERDKVRCTGKIWGVPFCDVSDISPERDALSSLDPSIAKRHCALPLERVGDKLTVAMARPLDIFVIDEVRMATGCEIEPLIAVESELKDAIIKFYELDSHVTEQLGHALRDFNSDQQAQAGPSILEDDDDDDIEDDDAPIIRLANLIINQAVADRASDIHMEPRKDGMVVRYRVDGVMLEVMNLPKKVVAPLTSRMKIVSNMDIAEKRAPQDNRISAVINGKPYDFRVSTLPTIHGEKIVMRVLDKGGINVGLEKLGFLPDNLNLIQDMASRSYGILLVTGPTGSGKSTTLYSILNQISDGANNIITIEDPVEYELEGINQCAVNNRAGMTFAAGLRAMLRQDPDVIMVGEMRDNETATIAMEAALTGHLVLSTLHTNDAPSAPTRLIDMEVEPFLISSSIIGVLAQRLVRNICPHCKEPVSIYVDQLKRYGFPIPDDFGAETNGVITVFKGAGCEKCKKTGYKGRTGIHELMEINDPIRDEILKKSPSHIIRRLAVENGMKTLQMDALIKILTGVTSVDEILRVVYS
ncbi:MAG: type II/IV secretion system protein [Armatimonadetes bacterium]|nr:type II/IV secretion system protein [Armatimonadota bacterium]